ncbi:MAG: hypothetical protein QHH06_13250 [Clostridiales bacterium]|jgi:magnesium-transporting ATPase (P-type)|nr:hypothetical protein [Eubacteriales bacterium]MDH7567410.1 hypothetical protein [Clostridiales bacterium]
MDAALQKTAMQTVKTGIPKMERGFRLAVDEIYLDGKLKKAQLIDEDEKSYGIFMHSLILSNCAEVMKVNGNQLHIIGDDYEKAIFNYTLSKGFDKRLIESVAPRVPELTFEYDDSLKVSTHLINGKMRIVSKGAPDQLLKRCSFILLDSKFVKITRRILGEVSSVLNDMIQRCVHVYAIAIKDVSKSRIPSPEAFVSDMALVALVGMGIA